MSRFDVEKFDSPPDPDLVCCICQCVLDGPVESPCRHVFCKICIETWLHRNRNCPTCRHRLKKRHLKPILPIVQNMLNRLLMFCDFRNNGCQEKVPLEIYDKHVNECDFKAMACKYEKCSVSVLRKFLTQHEEEECEHREKRCTEVCGLMIPVRIYDEHDCVEELRKYSQEQYDLVDTLKKKVTELNSLTEKLNQQIETLRERSMAFDVWMSSSDDGHSLSDLSSGDNYSDYRDSDQEDRGQEMTFEEFDRQDRNFWRSLRDFGDRPRRRRTRRRYRREHSLRREARDEPVVEIDVVNTPPRSPSLLPNPSGSDVDVVNDSDADRDSTDSERYYRRVYRSRRSYSRDHSRSSSRESSFHSSSRESDHHFSISSRSSRTRTSHSGSSEYSRRSRHSEQSSSNPSHRSSRNGSPISILSGESSLYHYRRRHHSSRRFFSSSRSRSRSRSRSFSPHRSRSRSYDMSAAESDDSEIQFIEDSIRDTGRDSETDRQTSASSSRFSHHGDEDDRCEDERDHINGDRRENQESSNRREEVYSSDDAQVTREWLPGRQNAQGLAEENHSPNRHAQSQQTSSNRQATHTGKVTKDVENSSRRSQNESGYGEGSSSSAENCQSRSHLKRKRAESAGDTCDYDYSNNKRRKREPAKSTHTATSCSSATNSSHQNRSGTSTTEHQTRSQRSNSSKPSSVNSQRTFQPVAMPEHSAIDIENYHSDSDHSIDWSPEGSDVTSSSVYDSGSDYEVLVPKSASQLLSEYASDESDESWTPGSSN